MKHKILFVLWLFISLFIGGCKTTKNVETSHSIDGLDKSEYIDKVLNNHATWNVLTARMTLEVRLQDKGTTQLNGNIRIRRDEVIQLSLAPVLGIEIGRLEISPEGLLVIDRVNKRYVQVSFEEIKDLARVDLGFDVLQALFLNEMYAPQGRTLAMRDFVTKLSSEEMLWKLKKERPVSYNYVTQFPSGWLTESQITLHGTTYGVDWKYARFQKMGVGMFPTRMDATFGGGAYNLSVGLTLSRLAQNDSWNGRTEVSSRYQKVELIELIKILF